MGLLSYQFPLHPNMALSGLHFVLYFCHGALGINFPGLRVPLSRPRTSIYSLESCTDTSSSGATSVTPVVLAAGDGRQFTTPGYDGSSGYGKQAKCLSFSRCSVRFCKGSSLELYSLPEPPM